MKNLIKKSNLLVNEALPYMQLFKGKIIIIKYGGAAMIKDKLKRSVMQDIAFLHTVGIKPVVVHGGGPFISDRMRQAKLKPEFVDGLRVTDAKTIEITREVFSEVSLEIIGTLSNLGVQAMPIHDAITVEQKNKKLGFVGEIKAIDTDKINAVLGQNVIPVISPLGRKGNQVYNINADTVATYLVASLCAEKLTILTDVDGVLENGKLISHLSIRAARQHIKKGVITKGMIPKIEACIHAVESGCKKAHLINGTIPHSLLFEIFTAHGIGTEIVKNGS